MNNYSLPTKLDKNSNIYLHPELYFPLRIKNVKENDFFYFTNFTKKMIDDVPYYGSYEIEDNDKEKIRVDNFNLKMFLYTIYDIETLDDLISWTFTNINETEKTIDRVLDSFLETFNKDDISIEIHDKLTEFYIRYLKIKYNKDIEYNVIYKIIKELKDGYIDTKYTYTDKKSYQNKIKKSLGI